MFEGRGHGIVVPFEVHFPFQSRIQRFPGRREGLKRRRLFAELILDEGEVSLPIWEAWLPVRTHRFARYRRLQWELVVSS